MQNITSSADIKTAIQLLEAGQQITGQQLKEQFLSVKDSLKPLNLLKSTLKDVSSSPFLISNIIITAASLATGLLTKKIVVSASANVFKKVIATVLQVGVVNLVATHTEEIKSLSQSIIQHLFHKKELKSKNIDG